MKNLLVIIFIVLMFLSCKNSSSSESTVDFEWRGGQSFSYNYSSGVLIGGT